MATGQPDAPHSPKGAEKPLTNLQRRFAECYARRWKGAPAAREAGYAEGSAKQTAKALLEDPRILTAIQEEAAKLGMSVDEATVRMSEWGRVSIDDVMVKTEEEFNTWVQKPLQELIDALQKEIEFDSEYAKRSADLLKLAGEQRTAYLASKQEKIDRKRLQVLEYTMRLERDATATEQVAGPKGTREVVKVDLVKVYDLKAGHMIKKVKPTRHGTEVELHDAKDATTTMLKVLGAFAPVKVDHTTNGHDMPGSNIMMPDNGRD